ncbi:PAAR domain-containing protein [Enterovibrio sp. ZSDZ42]|uniref:PAAR domain-containing protein n=1 Tax=Enterovibrio gelatinilyticus TaxID=2899819 RepID=A0ABT5R7V3_9GAMM|nr:PAAR domain-containing protein [Enterovibrio sp. ZSDZ42]MDD1796348.1 PAAR domain-containing protein [Enterovibrio sp. ZSDZ42]
MLKPIARIDDKHDCPNPDHCGASPNVIVSGTVHICEGKPIATVGDKLSCGGVITSGSAYAKIDGKSVAVLGSDTSCGGKIITGAQNGKA